MSSNWLTGSVGRSLELEILIEPVAEVGRERLEVALGLKGIWYQCIDEEFWLFTFVPYWINLKNDELRVLYYYYHNHFQMKYLVIQVNELDRSKLNKIQINNFLHFGFGYVILSVEFDSERIRIGWRRILFGFVELLGGCGILLFDAFSIVSLSEATNKKMNDSINIHLLIYS